MATAATPQSDYRFREGADQSRFVARWLKVWVALLAVVTLVVVVYLIAITNSLASINGNLATADDAVTGAGGDVRTLPDQVESVNASLGGIDPALQPITGQADAIVSNLTSINGKLVDVNSSLIDTDGSLKDTNGMLVSIDRSLIDTTGLLQSIKGLTADINGTLFSANEPNGPCGGDREPGTINTADQNCAFPEKDGVQNIHQRVAIANGDLAPALADANSIVASLGNADAGVVGSLQGICDSLVAGGVLGCDA
ncbi:MAG TPA: hypothetical protein VGV93_01725 [Acidimicrobiales bacterium]|nr:hypothetical protein [Acidimicrobiales bacterium]